MEAFTDDLLLCASLALNLLFKISLTKSLFSADTKLLTWEYLFPKKPHRKNPTSLNSFAPLKL